MEDIFSAPAQRDPNLQGNSISIIPAAIERCPLLELPAELRNNIYEFLFEHVTDNMLSTTICLGSDRPSRRYLREPQDRLDQHRSARFAEHYFSKESIQWPSKIDVPILRTCKSIYAEAGPYHSSRLSYYFIIRGEEFCDLPARIAEHSATWHQHLLRVRSITLQIDMDEGEKHRTRSEYLPMLLANLRATLSYLNGMGVLQKVQRLFLYEGYFQHRYSAGPDLRTMTLSNGVISELRRFGFREEMAVHVNPIFTPEQYKVLKDWLAIFREIEGLRSEVVQSKFARQVVQ
ncbi:hypothetical protein BST61_g8214 [Cercospora zeina]